MTAAEAKKIHARMYEDVQVIVNTIEEIEQTIYEITSAVALPIENCINPQDVVSELGANKKKLITELSRLRSVAIENHIPVSNLQWWEYNTEKAPVEIISELYNPFILEMI